MSARHLHRSTTVLLSSLVVWACEAEPMEESPAIEPSPAATDEDPSPELLDHEELADVYVPAGLAWKTEAGPMRADQALVVGLENRGRAALSVEWSLRSRTLDGAIDLRPLGAVTLPPGHEQVEAFSLGELPVRAHGTDVELSVIATLAREDGTSFALASEPRLVSFDADYRTATVRALPLGFDHDPTDAGTWESLANATVRKLGPDGTSQEGRLGPQLAAPTDPQAFPYFPLPELPPWVFLPRICMQWSAEYIDPSGLTDYLQRAGIQAVPASYAHFQLYTWGDWRKVFDGYLDADGCTPFLDIPSGQYTGGLETRFRLANETEIHVLYPNPGLGYREDFGRTGINGAVTISSGTYTFQSILNDASSRTGAFVSTALRSKDMIWPSRQTLRYHVNTPCPNPPGAGGCFTGSDIFIGTNNDGVELARFRHVLGHELGHWLQARMSPGLRLTGGDQSNYNDFSFDATCRCDHVFSANNIHCWNSREFLPAAAVEGFAHFFAAKVFNDIATTDCIYMYYKEALTVGGSVLEPPNAQLCSYPYRYMERRGCQDVNRGIEQDWLGFLWTIHTASANKLSLAEIQALFNAATTGGPLTWPSLQSAARSTLPAAKATFVIDTGVSFGIDH